MKLRTLCSSLILGALLCATQVSANSLTVAGPGQGLNGTDFALSVTPDNGTDKVFVETDSPTAETVFSAQFWIHADSTLRDDLLENRVLTFSVAFGNTSPSRTILMGIQRAANNPNNFRLWVYARNNATDRLVPYTVFNFVPDVDHRVRVEWAAGSPGSLHLYHFDNLKSQRNDLNLGGQDIERIRFGLPVGSAATGTTGVGTLRIDEVALTRTMTAP